MDYLNLLQLLFAAVIAFGLVYKVVPVLVRIAYHLNFYDRPDGERKLHTRYISSLGGVAIFLAFLVGFAVTGYADQITGFVYLLVALVMLFFIGLQDDLMGLSPNKKLGVELFASGMIILGCQVFISNFNGILGIGEIPLYIGIPLTLFIMIGITNAYNLIDGIDGLAGGIGVIASLFFAIGFTIAGSTALAVLSFITAITLIGFLVHNFSPASIFMGDTGSLVVGMLLAFLSIQFINLHQVSEFQAAFGAGATLLPVAFLAVPLYDTLTVVLKRIINKKSPFKAGRDHIHHDLLGIGFNHKQATLILCAGTVLISIFALALSHLNINLLLLAIILSAVLTLPTFGFKRALAKRLIGLDLQQYFRIKKAAEKPDESTDSMKDNEELVLKLAGKEKEVA